MDLQEFPEGDSKSPGVNAAHLVDLARRCVGRSEVLEEMAIAATVVSRPCISGTRGLSRWSGVSDRVLRNLTGPSGQTSERGLLWTRTRGSASPLVEDRESMELRYSDLRGDYRSTSLKYSQPSRPSSSEGGQTSSTGNAVVSARISERAQGVLDKTLEVLDKLTEMNGQTAPGKTLKMLDPGLDVWAEIEGEKPAYVAQEPLGRRAWSLAYLCGLQNVTLAMEDVEALTGLRKRGAQELVKRLSAWSVLVTKVRQGRSFVYEIRWHDVMHPDGEYFQGHEDRDNVRRHRAARDMEVQVTSARRGTGPGYLAYLFSTANPKRGEYLKANLLPAGADGTWRALVEAGDELALYGHLKAQEAEAGPVPSTPKALVEKAEEGSTAPSLQRRPAQESLGRPSDRTAEFMTQPEDIRREQLAAMRRRMARVFG